MPAGVDARIIDVREIAVPVESLARNAVIDFSAMTVSLVAVISDVVRRGAPVVGFGFGGIGRYAQGGILRDRVIPRVKGAAASPETVRAAAMRNEKPGGHGDRSVAVAAVEIATWDLVAKLVDKPAYAVIAESFERHATPRVAVYAAGGYYSPSGDIASLTDEIRRYLDEGYTHVKIKIGGAPLARDVERIEAVLRLLPDGAHLAVDANGRLSAAIAGAYVDALASHGLRWFEEPGDPLDFDLLRHLVADGRMTFATGENLFSVEEVRNLIRYGGLRPTTDVVQVDPALAYGVLEYGRIVQALDDAGWVSDAIVPHGGHLVSLHVAAGFGVGGCESYPGEFSPIGGFGPTAVTDGFVEVPEAPGFGLEVKPDLAPMLARLVA